ncbi:MAG: 4-hydroxy-tetrahydrodipicolinate synthase [Bryobacteraceae bacterium]
MPDRLQGIVTAIVTPFRDDERIDFSAWQKIIDSQIAAGVDGILVAGGQGEFFSLDDEERTVAVRFCRQYAGSRIGIYANVGCAGTRRTIHLAQRAAAEHVSALVVITPYYVRPSDDELAEHYIEVCRAVSLPVLAYNIPERSGVDLSPAVTRRIAETCENFVGLKDSSGHLDRIPELKSIGQDRPFAVFIGRDHLILPALEKGCDGAITACANVAPKLFVDLVKAYRAGDAATAARLQALADPLRQAFSLHTFPGVVKEAMQMIGVPAGPCRRPVGPMPSEARQKLADVLDRLRQEHYLPETAGAHA